MDKRTGGWMDGWISGHIGRITLNCWVGGLAKGSKDKWTFGWMFEMDHYSSFILDTAVKLPATQNVNNFYFAVFNLILIILTTYGGTNGRKSTNTLSPIPPISPSLWSSLSLFHEGAGAFKWRTRRLRTVRMARTNKLITTPNFEFSSNWNNSNSNNS